MTDARGIPERSLDVRLLFRVDVTELTIVLVVANRARRPVRCELSWHLDADFADIQEAQGGRREQQAEVARVPHDDCVELTYGHPTLPLRTRIHHDGAWTSHGDRVVANLLLEPEHVRELTLHVRPVPDRDQISDVQASERAATLRRWTDGFAGVEVPGNRVVEEILRSNVRDLGVIPAARRAT